MEPAARSAWSATIAARMVEALARESAGGDRLAEKVAAYAGLDAGDVAEIRSSIRRGRERRQNLVAAAAEWAVPIDEALAEGHDLPPALVALVAGVTPEKLDPLAGEVYGRVLTKRATDARAGKPYRRLREKSVRVEARELAARAAREADLGAVQWHYRPIVAYLVKAGVILTANLLLVAVAASWYFGFAAVFTGAAAAWIVVWVRRHAMLLLHDGGIVVTGVTGRLRMAAPWRDIAGIEGRSYSSLIAAWDRYIVTLRSGERVRFIAAARHDEPDLLEAVNRALRRESAG